MANYYLNGYMPPVWIRNSEDVKREQQRLGIKADGIWGEKTQTAYQNSLLGQYVPGNSQWLLCT